MTKMTLTIDGQVVEAEEGMTLLEIARKNSIHIPTLCYHPVLEAYGACRLCTVEVKQKGRDWSSLQTACTHPAWDGLDVKTLLRERTVPADVMAGVAAAPAETGTR